MDPHPEVAMKKQKSYLEVERKNLVKQDYTGAKPEHTLTKTF